MKTEIQLTDEQKSKVKEVYRKYYREKWYQSETPQAGYNKYYYATKVRVRLYYKTEAEAQKEAEKYNKRLQSYLKGKYGKEFPALIEWDMFAGTEVQNQYVWWHDNGSWLYEHGYDEWNTKELLYEYGIPMKSADGHNTEDFFDVLFSTQRFSQFYIKMKKNGEYSVFTK